RRPLAGRRGDGGTAAGPAARPNRTARLQPAQVHLEKLRFAQHKLTKLMNRLAQETSPYLLQHKNNPVDWFPWGEEAFAKARNEDKPIFLSIGYSACHWCHVMERESFENDGIASLLN